jgi:glycosyltransferase involved in cell wall biosynthesis
VKILYHHRTKSRDGQAVHIRELIAALRRQDHHVEEWALSKGDQGDMGSEGGAVGKLLARLPRVTYELAEHAYGPLVFRRLVEAGRACQADVLYERHALSNTAGVRAARALGIPLLLEVNSPLTTERSAHETLVLQRWAEACERRVFERADRLLVVTHVLADMLVEQGLPRDKICVIPNGADLSVYPREYLPEREEIVVGFTGFFRPWHGIESLVEGLAHGLFPAGCRLLLVGTGPAHESIENRAAELGVADRVQITGAVSREEIPGLVRNMDICVQPAATAWASPLKLFEYMAAGKAIVAPDQPNLTEILTGKTDALLFTPGKPEEMSAAVAELARDYALRAELGAAARQTLEDERYTWDANAERVVDIATSCLGVPVS